MSVPVAGTTAVCQGCRRRVLAETLGFIPYVGTFCPPCYESARAEIETRRNPGD